MFTTDNGHVPVVSTSPVTNTCLSNVILSPVFVKRAIRKLKAIVQRMAYHQSSLRLAPTTLLAYVYSQCMEFSCLLPDWLRAYATPVFKKGDPSCP